MVQTDDINVDEFISKVLKLYEENTKNKNNIIKDSSYSVILKKLEKEFEDSDSIIKYVKSVEKKIEEFINVFELSEFINTPVRNLSLGQRIRCEIVASLIHEPKVLFLDEPTIGLDPVVKENIRSLIKKMNKEYKTTIVLTSHDVSDIEKLCKRVIIINKGSIVLDDTMENLKYHYLNKKIIDAKMKEKINLEDEKGIKILKDKGYNLKIEVDLKKKNISDAIKLLDPDKIIDINISNTPLETIISSIYKGSKK